MPLDIPVYDDVYFSDDFKVVVRSCKEILLEGASDYPLNDRAFLYAHRNNFYALLRGLGFDERLLWTIAFINDINDPTTGFENKSILKTVTINAVDSIILPLRTKHY